VDNATGTSRTKAKKPNSAELFEENEMPRRSAKKRIAANQFSTLQKLFDVSTPPPKPPKQATSARAGSQQTQKPRIQELPSDALLKCFGDLNFKLVCVAAQVRKRISQIHTREHIPQFRLGVPPQPARSVCALAGVIQTPGRALTGAALQTFAAL